MNVRPPRAVLLLALASWAVGCSRAEKRASADVEPAAAVDESGTSLLVYVGDDGVTVIAGQPAYTDEQSWARAEEFQEKNPQGRVVVESHASALHGRTVRVLDLLKEAKIQHLALGVPATDTPAAGGAQVSR